jgi:zinc-ribbon domain
MPAGAGVIGRIVAIVALAALPLLLLLNWYRVELDLSGSLGGAVSALVPVHLPTQDLSGWQAFSSTDVAIVVVADVSILALALSFVVRSRLPLVLGTAGSLALVAMLVLAAVDPPDIVGARLDDLLPVNLPPLQLPHNGIVDAAIDTNARPGVWIALAAGIVALIGSGIALVTGADPATRRCPECAKLVSSQARVCRFCGHRFVAHGSAPVG